MGYDAYQTLLMRQQTQLLHEQNNLLRSASGLPPAAPLNRSGLGQRRVARSPVEQSRRDGVVVLVVLAGMLMGLLALAVWGVVELVAALLA